MPAFLISLAAGLLVTRSSNDTDLPAEFLKQLFSRPQALAVAGRLPGHLDVHQPAADSAAGASAAAASALAMTLTRRTARAKARPRPSSRPKPPRPAEERVEDYLAVDPMEVEIGVGLIRLADPKRGGDLLERIQRVRQNVAADIGIILPKVRIRDNMRLEQNQYRIKIADMPVAEGTGLSGQVPGHGFGHDHAARCRAWPPRTRPSAPRPSGSSPASATRPRCSATRSSSRAACIATHLTETVRQHADEILTRDATKHLIDELKQTSPAVVDELIPGVMKLAEVQQILQMLLREGVPIRQLGGRSWRRWAITRTRTKDPVLLTEYVRHRLARTICTRYRDHDNRLYVVTLDPALEDRIRAGFDHNEKGLFIRMSPPAVETTCRLIAAAVERLTMANHPPVRAGQPADPRRA